MSEYRWLRCSWVLWLELTSKRKEGIMSKQMELKQRIAEAKRIMNEKRTWVSAIEEARKILSNTKATLYDVQEVAKRLTA